MIEFDLSPESPFWTFTKVLCGISTLFVLARIYTRVFVTRFFGVDDALILIAMVAAMSDCVILWESFQFGLGEHVQNVTPSNLTMVLKLVFAYYMMYLLAAHAIRASLVVLYRRLSVSPRFLMICNIYLACNVILYISYFFVLLFMCSPVQYYWDKTIKGECPNAQLKSVTNSWFLIALDLGALALPIPALWKMKLPWGQRVWLGICFMIGSFVCIASFNRLTSFFRSEDVTYELRWIHAWSLLEINFGLIAACVPSLRHVFTPPGKFQRNCPLVEENNAMVGSRELLRRSGLT